MTLTCNLIDFTQEYVRLQPREQSVLVSPTYRRENTLESENEERCKTRRKGKNVCAPEKKIKLSLSAPHVITEAVSIATA